MKKKRIMVIVAISVILTAILITFLFVVVIPEKNNEAIRQMEIHNVDFSKLEDGIYPGEYAYGHYTYRVEVTIKDQRIANIDVYHGRDSKQAKAAEGVIDEIVAEQKINVDAISGATTTSKAILKAVELALSK